MRRTILALTLIALVFLMFGRRVEAESATTGDPTGDVFDQQAQTSGPGKLDLVSVGHSDDGVRATYTITLKDGFHDADIHSAEVGIDGLPGVAQYDCQQISASVVRTGNGLSGQVKQCLGSGGGAEGGSGGVRDLGPLTYEHTEGSEKLELSFELASLRDAGFHGSSYRYRILIIETGQNTQDWMPNEGEAMLHVLSAPPTPVPAAPIPPTPATSPTPTPIETPTVTVTTSSVETSAPQAASFGAPEEKDEESGFPVIPVAAGGGVVLAGVAFALVRFLHFL